MAIKKRSDKKRTKMLLILLGALAIATGIYLYWVYFSTPSDVEDIGIGTAAPGVRLKTDFETKILEDSRIQNLKIHGPSEIKVEQRGQKEDLFEPF